MKTKSITEGKEVLDLAHDIKNQLITKNLIVKKRSNIDKWRAESAVFEVISDVIADRFGVDMQKFADDQMRELEEWEKFAADRMRELEQSGKFSSSKPL